MTDLKELRIEAGFTQMEMAVMLRISLSHYYYYEKGERYKIMAPNMERKISDILGIEYHYTPRES